MTAFASLDFGVDVLEDAGDTPAVRVFRSVCCAAASSTYGLVRSGYAGRFGVGTGFFRSASSVTATARSS